MAKLKRTTIYIKGMHCPSCDILIADKFKEEKNIIEVKPDFKNQRVEIFYHGKLNKNILNQKIKSFGYQILDKKERKIDDLGKESLFKRIFDFIAISVILLIIYFFIKELDLISDFNLTGNVNYLTVFFIGLIASVSTCMATSGALYLSLIDKSQISRPEGDRPLGENSNLSKAIFFSAGRILSYGFFGFLAGLVGQVLTTNLKLGPVLTLLVAIFMILLGLDMARLLTIGKVIPTGFLKKIFESLEERIKKYPRKLPFLLGAITYFLPCGFTQTVQVYALGLASPVMGAMIMIAFVIGTIPSLILVGTINKLVKSGAYLYFMKTMGVLVLLIGLIYFSNFLSINGININPFSSNSSNSNANVRLVNGKQEVEMEVISSGYQPNYFVVKKGVPVKWLIKGVNVFGCQGYFVVPKLGISQTLQEGENIFEFTPDKTGNINFSCGMGMYRGIIEVK